jgi:hypothetical protein
VKNRLWAWACFAAALLFAASTALSWDFRGYDPQQFPYVIADHPIQPAGYAFAIWGLIIPWLVLGTGFGALRRMGDEDWAPARPYLALTLVIGAAWLPVAKLSPLLATVLIIAMTASSLRALFRLGDTDPKWQQAPVAILSGWLTAASCVSVGVVLGGYGLPLTPVALLMLATALGIASVTQYRLHRAPEYGMTMIWALVGIIASNWSPVNAAVNLLAIVGILVILSIRATDTE